LNVIGGKGDKPKGLGKNLRTRLDTSPVDEWGNLANGGGGGQSQKVACFNSECARSRRCIVTDTEYWIARACLLSSGDAKGKL